MTPIYEYLAKSISDLTAHNKITRDKTRFWIKVTSGEVHIDGNVYLSMDGYNWQEVEDYTVSAGTQVFLRKNSDNVIFRSGRFEAGGLLTDFTRYEGSKYSSTYREFYNLFNSSGVTSAADLILPDIIGAESCLRMFRGCTYLKTPPQLPATKINDGCYCEMFFECKQLTQAPELPATRVFPNCYREMFKGCHSLLRAPELPATVLASSCYTSMFNECISLIQAPDLPATVLASSCYSFMFTDCRSLQQAPKLHADTLLKDCYYFIFADCRNLRSAEISCNKMITGSCDYMFRHCHNLNQITLNIRRWVKSAAPDDWVDGVGDHGVFIKPANVNIPEGTSGIPSGWSVQDI